MSRFLLDANLSPETAAFLAETLQLDVVRLRELLPGSPTGEQVTALAKQVQRVIITFDTDFGEIHNFRERGRQGFIILKLRNQTIESVNHFLARFFVTEAPKIDPDSSLVTIEEYRVRIVRPH